MKHFLIVLLSCLAVIGLSAQEPVFTWNKADTKPAMQISVDIMGYTSDGFFVVSRKPATGMQFSPTIIVEYFNASQDRVFVKDITPPSKEDFIDVLYYDGGLHLFTSLYTKESGKNILSATTISKDRSLSAPKEIMAVNAEKLSVRGRYDVNVSPDGSKLAVLYEPNYSKGENERISLTVYHPGFSKRWGGDFTFSYEWTKAVGNDLFINNSGTPFIIKRTDMKGDDNTYSVFSSDGKALKEYKIALDGKKKVATIVSAFSPEGDFATAGYYTEENKVRIGMGTALHGSFLCRIDANGQQAKFNLVVPFEKRKDIIAKNILFHQSNMIVLGERYYVSSQAPQRDPSKPMTNEDMFARDYSYYGRDIIIDGYDAGGKFMYNTNIDKDNNSKNDNGTWVSFFAAIVKDKLRIVFVDDKYKYDDKKRIFIVGSPKIIVHSTVDPTSGTATATLPVNNTGPVGGKGGDMLMRPDVFLQIDGNRFIVRAENPRISRMGLLSF